MLRWKWWLAAHKETAHGDVKSRPVFVQRAWKTLVKEIIGGCMHTQTYQRDTGHAHELAPQCAQTYSWAECWDGVYLCGLPTERPRWVIPAAVFSHSKHMTTGWLSKPLSGICLIWAFCLHLFSAPRLKAAALPLFASPLGSEENDNNEAWRLSTTSHKTFTLITPGTQTTLQMQTHTTSLTLCYSRHTHTRICILKTHTHTYTCNVKWMQVAISFCSCHTKCANKCQLFIFAI